MSDKFSEMSMFNQLVQAIYDLQEKFGIKNEETIILSPTGTMISMFENSLQMKSLVKLDGKGFQPNKFLGILILEDPALNKIVVRSMVSDHRIEIDPVI